MARLKLRCEYHPRGAVPLAALLSRRCGASSPACVGPPVTIPIVTDDHSTARATLCRVVRRAGMREIHLRSVAEKPGVLRRRLGGFLEAASTGLCRAA